MQREFQQFKTLVQGHYGDKVFAEVNQYLASIAWKLALAQYHAEESTILYRGNHGKISNNAELVQVVYEVLQSAANPHKARKLLEDEFLSEAHVIAYAQSLHSIADILAQAIYSGLNLEKSLSSPIDIGKRGLYPVYKRMLGECYALDVAQLIDALLQSPSFLYLEAYVNITKHHSVVDWRYAISFETPNRRHGIRMLPFDYKGKCFPERWAADFISEDYKEVCDRVDGIVMAMNGFLTNLH